MKRLDLFQLIKRFDVHPQIEPAFSGVKMKKTCLGQIRGHELLLPRLPLCPTCFRGFSHFGTGSC